MSVMFRFLAYYLPLTALCFILSIAIHEMGHLTGGLLCGYRFSSFEIMGVFVIRTGGRLKFGIRKKTCLGQCVMYTDNFRTNAVLLILGGVIANGILSAVSALLFAVCLMEEYTADAAMEIFMPKSCHMEVFFLLLFILNTMAVICNVISDDPANDGNTYADAAKSSLHTEAYNRIMCIYAKLNEGCDIREIDGRLFDLPDMFLSSLSAELAFFRFMHLRGQDIVQENIEIKRLEKFAPGLIDPEEVYNTGSFRKND